MTNVTHLHWGDNTNPKHTCGRIRASSPSKDQAPQNGEHTACTLLLLVAQGLEARGTYTSPLGTIEIQYNTHSLQKGTSKSLTLKSIKPDAVYQKEKGIQRKEKIREYGSTSVRYE